MKTGKVLAVVGLTLVILVAVILLRLNSQTRQNGSSELTRPVAVSVASVRYGTITSRVNATGDIEGIHEAEVISETSGKIVAITSEVDTYLRAGGSIARVESELQEIMLEQAKAQRAAAQESSDKATLDFRRVKSLYEQNAVSESQKENAELAAKAALAQLRSAQAAERLAQKHFDDTVLRTPIAGRLAEKFVTVGKMLSPGMKVATVVDDSRLKLNVGVSEEDVASIRPGDGVEISCDAVKGIRYTGKVRNVTLKADPLTRTFQAEIEFPNDKTRSLKSGMFVRAVIYTSSRDKAIIVPSSALLESVGQVYNTFVVKSSRAFMRPVTIGARTDSLVEVTSGLVPGDTVITFGQQNLKDGAAVMYGAID